MGAGIGLDIALVLLLVGYFVYGFRAGLARAVFVVAGVVAGAVAAFFLAPLVGQWVPAPEWRIAATVAIALGLVLAGHTLGATIGAALRTRMVRSPLGVIDKVAGAVTTTVAAALVASVLAVSVGSMGFPFLSSAVGQSATLRTINALTPDPVEVWLAQLRTAALEQGIPLIVDALGDTTTEPPVVDSGTGDLSTAAQSVVRITGTAYACGQSQSGTGFVISPDRIVTNAHVVAGVEEPVVETPAGQVLTGRILYFDPADDLAVIGTDGLSAAPLAMSPTLAQGATAVIDGYPFGGPFTSTGAEVISVSTIGASDIYGTSTSEREVYTLAADVNEGNSGGPLLAETGAVAGVVFARSASADRVGYAMTMTELSPVAAQAPTLSAPVSSGDCIRG